MPYLPLHTTVKKEIHAKSLKPATAFPTLFFVTNNTSWFCTALETRNWSTVNMRRHQLGTPFSCILNIWTALWETLTLILKHVSTSDQLHFHFLSKTKQQYSPLIPRAPSLNKTTAITKAKNLKVTIYFRLVLHQTTEVYYPRQSVSFASNNR